MKALLFTLLLALLPVANGHAIRLKSLPYLQNVGETEATIVWTSDKISVGWVEIALDDGSHFYATERERHWNSCDGIKQKDTVHVVKLTGLRPGTRYRYRVFAQEVLSHKGHRVHYGDITATDVYSKKPLSFVTADSKAPETRFAMINDLHGDNRRLEALVALCPLDSTDFFVFNGDMVSHFSGEKQVFDGFMDTAIRLFASEVPMVYTRGNHETRSVFAPQFHRYFSPSEQHLYFTFQRGPVFFVVLDTGEDKPDSDLEYAGITDYDSYRSKQAEWLRGILASEAYRNAPFRVVIGHIPPMGGWHGNAEVAAKFVSQLRTASPDLMLCGHLHQYVHQPPTPDVPFPVIVNLHRSVLKVKADNRQLHVEVIREDGRQLDKFTLERR